MSRSSDTKLAVRAVPTARSSPELETGAEAEVEVEVASVARFATLGAEWNRLVRRAALANVSMHPAAAQAASAAGADVCVLLAWRGGGRDSRRLVGVWVMAQGRLLRRWPVRALLAPCNGNLILGTPVVDRDGMAGILRAFLEAAEREPSLPPILHIREFAGDEALTSALREALAAHGARTVLLSRMARPSLETGLDADTYVAAALSRKRRAELGRCRRRLSERGVVEVTTHGGAESVAAAFEAFLALEARGWKGRDGGALARRAPATQLFVTELIHRLAAAGAVLVVVLRLDGRPVAIEVVLRCGDVAHTWKSAYDEDLRSLAPGFVLLEALTRSFLADPTLRLVDMSNNAPLAAADGVGAFWRERHEVSDLLVEVRRAGFAGLWLSAFVVRGRRACGAALRRLREGRRLKLAKRGRTAGRTGCVRAGATCREPPAAGPVQPRPEEEPCRQA